MELHKLRSRRRAREAAVQALYCCDQLSDWSLDGVQTFCGHFLSKGESEVEHDHYRFCRELVEGVRENLSVIDALLSTASNRWNIERMSIVDRNILRLAVYEIAYVPDIPNNVSVNEGIELAKLFGAEDSATFVNGVLDRCLKITADTALLRQIHQDLHLKVVNG